ncbi:hydantoinase/carbamoylase family amidase [Pseudochelatococcus sp. B33]
MARSFTLPLNGPRLLGDIEALAKFGARPEGGISRPAFSPAFRSAADWLARRMREAGLDVHTDAAGNIIGRLGPPGPAVVCGSHIDTVPGGGALDGALGVLAGLECARVVRETGLPLACALEIIAFADEEGAYVGLFGSRAMMGELHDGMRASAGFEKLSAAMRQAGLDPGRIGEAQRPSSDIAAYIELHIEQGPVLDNAGIHVGVVDSIVGMDMARYRLTGEARHAGSTPMAVRRDAGRGSCLAVSAAFEAMRAEGLDATGRMTFGSIRFLPGASNVIPAEAIVTSEVRAASAPELRHLRGLVDTAFAEAARCNGLSLATEDAGIDEPAPLAPSLIATITRTAGAIGVPVLQLPSGACHDAQILARKVPAGMIFVASRDGISHHPDEYSTPESIVAGARLLLQTLGELLFAGEPP